MTRSFLGLFILMMFSSAAHAQTFTNEFFRLNVGPDPTLPIAHVSLADYNADGLLDIYHSGRLYRQQADGTFSNLLERAGIQVEGNAVRGGLFADANGDGLLDLLIMDSGPGSRFYLNRSAEKFDLANGATNLIFRLPIEGGFFDDVNLDGYPDLVAVASNGEHPVFAGSAEAFINIGPLMRASTPPSTCALAVADFDRDQDADFYAANCGRGNQLMVNDAGRDRFAQSNRYNNMSTGLISIDAHWFDFDNDGWEDLIISNELGEFTDADIQLFRNQGGTAFEDVATAVGINGEPTWTKGYMAVADFDNNGWQDVVLARGNRGRYFRNQEGQFEEVFEQSFGLDSVSVALAAGDLDNDGWMDLVYPSQFGTQLMMNDGGSNHWVTFETRFNDQNPWGVGARLEVTTGDLTQVRIIRMGTGSGNQSQPLRAHFGVGTASSIDQLRILWPDGSTESYSNLAVDTHYTVVEGQGFNDPPSPFSLLAPEPSEFIDTQVETIPFSWEASTDTNQLRYTLTITGKGTRLSFPNIVGSSFDVPASSLPQNQIYEWSVITTDGHTVRGSQEERTFVFGRPETANQTLQAPVLYDFGLPNLSSGEAKWADMDGDGDLDLFVGGEADGVATLGIYRADDATIVSSTNGGDYVFKTLNRTNISLELVRNPHAAWGDVEQDGFTDLLVTGISVEEGEPRTNLYANTIGQLIPIILPDNVPDVWGGAVDVQDVNRDGYLDLFLTGSTTTAAPHAPLADVWLGDGNGGFTKADADLTGLMFGDAALGDFDGDGDLDLAMTGDRGDGKFVSTIYRNEGVGEGGRFVPFSELPGLYGGSVSWGDADSDGDLDLLLTGGSLSPDLLRGQTYLYINEESSFQQHPFPFDGVVSGRAIWGDYESDGDQDIFIVGAVSPLGSYVGRLYRNEEGRFEAELDVQGFLNAYAAFGDYNQDSDLDLIVFGVNAEGTSQSTFYINQQVPEPVPVTR